ncbi:MAG: ABC transporter substrate-binding protein [Chitinophagales bacterium]
MQKTKIFIDQMQRKIVLKQYPPKRIISLVPSQTELLADLGLDKEVVGITKFCIYPNRWFREKKRVGGTKDFKIAEIEALEPDIIIANKEENEPQKIEILAKKYPIWISDIQNLEQAYEMIRAIGHLTNKEKEATFLLKKLREKMTILPKIKKWHVAYFIWRKPYMAAAKNTFIDEILEYCGFTNVLSLDYERYPVVLLENLKNLKLDIIFLSSEPYPFKEKHIAEIKTILPHVKVVLVDGEMFSWYGSRLLKTADYCKKLLLELA